MRGISGEGVATRWRVTFLTAPKAWKTVEAHTSQIYASGYTLRRTPWNTLDQFRQRRVCRLSPKSLEKVLTQCHCI